MKNFIEFVKENSYIIVKFILTHVVMSLLGIMVGLAVLLIESDSDSISTISIIGSLFTIGFMCFMHYDDMYFFGAKEGIRIRSEGTKGDVFKGLKLCLIGYSPVLLSGIATIIVEIVAGNVENASPIALLIYYAMQGSFLGLYKLRVHLGVIAFVIITLLPALISGALGYALGFKDKTLRGIVGINVKPPYDGPMERKPKNKNDHE